MSSLKYQILDHFEIVRRERDDALRRLSQAEETIRLLEAEVTTVKYHGDIAYAKVADEQGMSKSQIERIPFVEVTDSTAWIDEIWLCSPENKNLLGSVEEKWREHPQNPQSAIILATKLSDTKPVKQDRLKCKLLLAAVQFSAGSLELACALANDCIRDCGTEPRFKDIAGIGHYIRGRVFAAMKLFLNAHWDFSMAVHTKGYHDKVKNWQGFCDTCIVEENAEEMIPDDDRSSSEILAHD